MKLSINIKIHDVIFIIHLKSIIDFIKNLYRRRRLLISIVIINNKKNIKSRNYSRNKLLNENMSNSYSI